MHEREQALRDKFSIGVFVGYYLADSAEKYQIILVSEMPPENFANTKIHPVKTLAEALVKAGDKIKKPCITKLQGIGVFPVAANRDMPASD